MWCALAFLCIFPVGKVLAGASGQNSEYVFRGLDYILATANSYNFRARNTHARCCAACMDLYVLLRCMPAYLLRNAACHMLWPNTAGIYALGMA